MDNEKYIIIRYGEKSGITYKSDWSEDATLNYLKAVVEEMENTKK